MKVFGTVAALLILFLLPPPSALSQTSLGFQAGMSMATLGGKDAGSGLDNRMGFGAGAFLNFSLSDILSVQPEVNFMQKGATETEEGYDASLKLDYVEVPILLRFNIPMEGSISPYLMLGPSIAFKAGCTIGVGDSGTTVDVDCEEAEFEVSSMDFGGVLAAGLGFDAGPGQVFVGARYYAGFTSLDDSGDDADVKNKGFFFSGGYSFPIGG